MSVELTNIKPMEAGGGQENPGFANSKDNIAQASIDRHMPQDGSAAKYEIYEDPDSEVDADYNSCERGVNSVQTAVFTFCRENKTWIFYGIGVVFLTAYFVYFAYALSYKFGDEESVRLLWVTIVAVLIGLYNLLGDCCTPSTNKLGDFYDSPDNKRKLKIVRWCLYIIASVAIIVVLVVVVGIPNPSNLLSLAGIAAFLVICYVTSTNPGRVNWHPVFWGLAMQFFFACIILRTQWGFDAFEWLGNRTTEFLAHTDAGSGFVFGNTRIHFFAFVLMPVVTFFSSVIAVTYYLGIMQAVVRVLGRFLAFCLGTTPAESLNAAGNIFVGMTEAPLMIKPFLETMTRSELHAVMTGGFATIAGSVLGAYIGFGVPANHLISASVMSAPAALAISKLMCPETEKTTASSEDYYKMKSGNERNVIEAASNGATMSIKLIANIVVNLIAFLAFLSFFNATVAWLGERAGQTGITFQFICSYLLYPVALFMGARPADCRRVAELVGIKTFTNEFIAYDTLRVFLANRQTFLNYTVNNGFVDDWEWNGDDIYLQKWNVTLKGGYMEERSEVISTYALCGFANVGSMGIMLGALSAMAPSRKPVLATLVLRAMMAGNIACFMTACIAGLFFTESRFGNFQLS